MTVWSLTTDTDHGIVTRLYLTEEQAYEALADLWFPNADAEGDDLARADHHNKAAMLWALAKGIPAVSRWFDEHIEATCDNDRAVIFRHDHPWVFAAEVR